MTRILTVEVARFGDEVHALQVYDEDGGGRMEFPGTMSLDDFVREAYQRAQHADFVCVETTGLGVAVYDRLHALGVGALTMNRYRAFPK